MRKFINVVFMLVLLGTSGCAGSITSRIVDARNHQGDVALAHGNPAEASISYQLALKLDRANEHAKAGLSAVQLSLAEEYFREGKLDNARQALNLAAKSDPGSVAVAELRSQIDQARIGRQLVISNYPAYKEVGDELLRSYEGIEKFNKTIIKHLKTFDYNYNTDELSTAIRDSYEMSAEIVKYTNRMAAFRQLVESGMPDTERAAQLASPASLLPLP